MVDRGGAGNGQHDRRTLQQPGQSNLHGSPLSCFCDAVENLAGHPAGAEREPWDEGDLIALAVVDDIIPFAVGETVAVLYGDDGHNLARALDVLLGDIGKTNAADLSFSLQLSQSFDRGFNRGHGIGRVELVNIDAVEAQPLETAFNWFAQMCGSRVVRPLVGSGTIPSSFGGDDKILGIRKQSFGDQLFVDVRTVGVGGSVEVDALFHSAPKHGQCRLAIFRRTPDSIAGKAHGSKTEAMDGKPSAERS